LAAEVSAIDGPLEVRPLGLRKLISNSVNALQLQQEQVQAIQSKLPELDGALAEVSQAETACQDANVDENDYTVFTHQDLEFELDLVVQSITKKIKFIENQASATSSLNHPNTHRYRIRLSRGI
jgi:hypothetical protein